MEIQHIPEKGVFEAQGAFLKYELRENGQEKEMLFTHTFTAPEHRGKGIAAALVKEGLAYAKANGYKIVPVCPYVVSYLERHPQEG
ncbi:MAG: N-acetyltransferase [Alphaproteobacteria bacterium]|nr:N-acetyltransferase [Alphaproteobacteria bacterium]